MELDEYVRANYPQIAEEYERYLKRDQLPQVGELMESLVRGFGGDAGLTLTVTEVDEDGITLIDGDRSYWSDRKIWYKQLKRVS